MEALKQSRFLVFAASIDVIFIDRNDIAFIRSLQWQLSRNTINDIQATLSEGQGIRHDHIQRLAADDYAVNDQLHLNLTVFNSSENTVLNGANVAVRNLPHRVLGNGRGIASVADTGSRHGQAGADGQVIIIRSNVGVVKLL